MKWHENPPLWEKLKEASLSSKKIPSNLLKEFKVFYREERSDKWVFRVYRGDELIMEAPNDVIGRHFGYKRTSYSVNQVYKKYGKRILRGGNMKGHRLERVEDFYE